MISIISSSIVQGEVERGELDRCWMDLPQCIHWVYNMLYYSGPSITLCFNIYIYIFVNTDMIKLYCRKTLASFSVFQYKYSLFSIYIDDTKSIEYFISSLTFHLRAIIHLMQICCANEPVLLRPQRHDRIIRRHLFEHNPSDDLHTVPRVQV
jgi:hypothetical protein